MNREQLQGRHPPVADQEMSKVERNITREEFHVSSLVVLTQSSLRHRLAEQIATLAGAEIHAVSDEGKLVVTLEGAGQRPIMAAIDTIQAMPGVLSAALIYHQFDTFDNLRDTQCEDMP